jgi:hypothetical protein
MRFEFEFLSLVYRVDERKAARPLTLNAPHLQPLLITFGCIEANQYVTNERTTTPPCIQLREAVRSVIVGIATGIQACFG